MKIVEQSEATETVVEELSKKFREEITESCKFMLDQTNLSDEFKKEFTQELVMEIASKFDQAKFQHEGQHYRPLLCFLTGKNFVFWDEETKLFTPYEAYQQHELVYGEVNDIFNKKDK